MTSLRCFLISRALFQRFCESMVDILIPTAQHITEVLSCHGHIGKRPGENVGFNRDHVPCLGGSMQMYGEFEGFPTSIALFGLVSYSDPCSSFSPR